MLCKECLCVLSWQQERYLTDVHIAKERRLSVWNHRFTTATDLRACKMFKAVETKLGMDIVYAIGASVVAVVNSKSILA